MKIAIAIAASALLWSPPAQADIFYVSGAVDGISASFVPCDSGGGFLTGCLVETPQSRAFGFSIFNITPQGPGATYEFSEGQFTSGVFEGTFVNVGPGAFVGTFIRFNYSTLDCGPGSAPALDCAFQGMANSFSVQQVSPAPVPEPGTWGMLLLGFGLLGGAIRSSRRRLSASFA